MVLTIFVTLFEIPSPEILECIIPWLVQVNQLLQVAEKCQSTIDQSGSDGIHQQDLQANSNM